MAGCSLGRIGNRNEDYCKEHRLPRDKYLVPNEIPKSPRTSRTCAGICAELPDLIGASLRPGPGHPSVAGQSLSVESVQW